MVDFHHRKQVTYEVNEKEEMRWQKTGMQSAMMRTAQGV